jgi:hypothetical protein
LCLHGGAQAGNALDGGGLGSIHGVVLIKVVGWWRARMARAMLASVEGIGAGRQVQALASAIGTASG